MDKSRVLLDFFFMRIFSWILDLDYVEDYLPGLFSGPWTINKGSTQMF